MVLPAMPMPVPGSMSTGPIRSPITGTSAVLIAPAHIGSVGVTPPPASAAPASCAEALAATNVLVGNAFVTTPQLADNYGAEAFWANTPAVATVSGNTATLQFDNVGYDAVPSQFAVEIQSPAEATGQQVVTAGLSGNLLTAQMTGAAQVGTGLAFNEKEAFASFNGWLTGVCQARGTITGNSPRVPNGLGNLLKTGQAGYLKFNIGAGVGVLLTPQTATWKGIRTLHKTQTTTTTLTIPILVPVC